MPFSLAIVLLIAGYTWVVEPLMGQAPVPVFAVAVVLLGLWHAARRGDWGWSTRALLPGLVAATAFTILVAMVLMLVSGFGGDRPMRFGAIRSDTARWLLLWGGAQQWLLQTTFLREAQNATSAKMGRLVAPLLFGALHLPNPFLTLVTTGAAFGWCAIYDRYPNVVPVALSHAIGTVIIRAAFDDATTGRLRVGYSYLQL